MKAGWRSGADGRSGPAHETEITLAMARIPDPSENTSWWSSGESGDLCVSGTTDGPPHRPSAFRLAASPDLAFQPRLETCCDLFFNFFQHKSSAR